jgi:hypothetical protein
MIESRCTGLAGAAAFFVGLKGGKVETSGILYMTLTKGVFK